MNIAKAKNTECPYCKGRGVTHETKPEFLDPDPQTKKFRTLQQGSGCPNCCGTGQLEILAKVDTYSFEELRARGLFPPQRRRVQ